MVISDINRALLIVYGLKDHVQKNGAEDNEDMLFILNMFLDLYDENCLLKEQIEELMDSKVPNEEHDT